MKALIICVLALSGCVTGPPTKAGIRRGATYRLASCLKNPGFKPMVQRSCLRDSVVYCESRGLEKTCGSDGLWTQ